MGEIIKLGRFKKSKARDKAASEAEANRLKFGRTKAQRSLDKAENDLQSRKLDDHKREE